MEQGDVTKERHMKKPESASFASVEDSEILDVHDHGIIQEQTVPDEEGVKTGEQLETYIEDIADTVRVGLDQSISILTPWFFNNMPSIYYQTTPRQEKVRHLSAIITGHVFETKQTVELWDRDRSKITFIGPGGDRKILIEMAQKLKMFPFKLGAIYFSRDRLLYLGTFFCNQYRAIETGNGRITEKIAAARRLLLQDFPEEPELIDEYLGSLDNDFVIYATARRIQLTFRMVRYMMSHEGAHTICDPFENSSLARLTIGMKNVEPSTVMETIFHLIQRYDFTLRRAFVIHMSESRADSVTVIHLILEIAEGKSITPDSVPMRKLSKACRTLGWVDVDEYDVFSREPYNLSVNAVNFVRSLANWVHVALGKQNPYIYSMYKIQSAFFKHSEEAMGLVDLFRVRFDPMAAKQRENDGYRAAFLRLKEKVEKLIEEVDRNIFHESLNFIDHILKTNYFLRTKTGLAFRMSPDVLSKKFYPNRPFGFFYIVGKDFRFFQVRWKDISRGGLRVVMPRSSADYDYSLSGLFDEVYGLSYAQQLKNKDIPEGGSKAVLVLKPGGHRDQAVRGAVNALLDLLVSEDESHEGRTSELVSYLNREEIIYLGPDENITNELINWITQQAARRGYVYASAFMSSKPGAGINHKEFGVTSEGLNVFLHNMLHHLGIDPRKQSFMVKMTGGPDGDVAGNELNILHREFGENARVVAVADGFGAAYDPDGLNWKELKRLFKSELSIYQFDPKQLSSKSAFVVRADNNEDIRKRNELAASVYADIFIPAGGRPYTVNDENWTRFIASDGKPTVRAVVEGANIFFTQVAREKLQEKGVLFIKDSSANKTGVICSSFEIIACLVLSTAEFNAIKPVYVSQVIEILKSKADAEAKLLFREYANFNEEKSLVELSLMISREINDVTDSLLDELTSRQDEVLANPLFKSLILKHCPAILVEKYRDRILEKLPSAHKIAILSAYIASHIVYREGLGWLHRIPVEERFIAAQTYMMKGEIAESLIEEVRHSKLKHREQIEDILRRSAARDLTMIEIEEKDAD
jgi:glutamate dehydrogenase